MEVIKGREVSWGWVPKSHSREAEGPVLEYGSHHSVLSESVPGRGVVAGARDPGAGEQEQGGWYPGSGCPREAGKVETTRFVTLVSKRGRLGQSLFWDSDAAPTLAFQLL